MTEWYAAWRRLTEREGDAIRAGDWGLMEQSQRAKEELKRELVGRNEPSPEGGHEFELLDRPVVAELIRLEHENHALLCARKLEVEAELATLQGSSRALQGLHRAYGSKAAGAWGSYS